MIVARAIKTGKPFQSSIFRDEMKQVAKGLQKDALDDFKRTVATWKDKPKFSSKIFIDVAHGIQIQVATDDPIYGYIDKGTKVRYATMSKDWKSKTEPDVIQSFRGKGKKLFVNKKYPRPGIKARNFTKHIAKTTQKELQKEVKNAMARFARRSGYGI